MGNGIKVLRQYSEKIKKSQAELKGFRTKAADARRKRNYLIGATTGLALAVVGVSRMPNISSLVNILWTIPVATGAGAVLSKKCMEDYENLADAENRALDIYQTTYDSERKAIFDSVRCGKNGYLTELYECFEAELVSSSERDRVLTSHRLNKSNIAYRTAARDEEERLKHERQSQEDDPNDGYDGWLTSE